jgi:hypothetical protein
MVTNTINKTDRRTCKCNTNNFTYFLQILHAGNSPRPGCCRWCLKRFPGTVSILIEYRHCFSGILSTFTNSTLTIILLLLKYLFLFLLLLLLLTTAIASTLLINPATADMFGTFLNFQLMNLNSTSSLVKPFHCKHNILQYMSTCSAVNDITRNNTHTDGCCDL